MPSLSDLSHMDPCRFCRVIDLRADLLRASKVLGEGTRGYVCRPGAKRRGLIS